jgi:hypothetical protein
MTVGYVVVCLRAMAVLHPAQLVSYLPITFNFGMQQCVMTVDLLSMETNAMG